MKRKHLFLIIVLVVGVLSSVGCSGNKIAGDYIGEGSSLTINKNKTWSYFSEGWIEDYEIEGTYEKLDDDTYKMISEDFVLYGDLNEDNSLYIYSDDSKWIAETFKRIG